MKNTLLTFGFLAAIIGLCSYSNGSFTSDYMGFGIGQSCAQIGCHEGIGTSGAQYPIAKIVGSNGVNLVSTGGSYIMGETYDIEITAPASSARVGFQALISTFFADSGVGTISNTVMPANIQLWSSGIKNRQYLTHTFTGMTAAVSGGVASFKFKWTAPFTNVGAVKLAVTLNKSNGNSTKTGDSILQGNYPMQSPTATVGITNPHNKINALQIYPNPATDVLQINVSAAKYGIYTVAGSLVKFGALQAGEKSIDVQGLSAGQYVLMAVDAEGKVLMGRFEK
jgi:Secretion system C-terminal sorting domain